jgi:hypothetical protein
MRPSRALGNVSGARLKVYLLKDGLIAYTAFAFFGGPYSERRAEEGTWTYADNVISIRFNAQGRGSAA